MLGMLPTCEVGLSYIPMHIGPTYGAYPFFDLFINLYCHILPFFGDFEGPKCTKFKPLALLVGRNLADPPPKPQAALDPSGLRPRASHIQYTYPITHTNILFHGAAYVTRCHLAKSNKKNYRSVSILGDGVVYRIVVSTFVSIFYV